MSVEVCFSFRNVYYVQIFDSNEADSYILPVSHTQLDALSPAVDVLVRDLPVSSTREKAVLTLKTAVEVC